MTPEPTPIHDTVLAELGPLKVAVDTDWDVLLSKAVLALAAK